MKNFRVWLNNASIQRKFVPLQIFIIFSVIFISLFSIFSLILINNSSEKIIEENVRDKEKLSEITRNMYVCRVLGRDILLQEDEAVRSQLYDEYITAFDDLDYKMDEFSSLLNGAKKFEFENIIKEKNIYKDSMILSADIWMSGGKYEDALYALQVVTPIANDFFGSIDDFSEEEEILLNAALEENDNLVLTILILSGVINIVAIIVVILFIRFFSKTMSASLIKLEKSMSKIAETGNMKIEIPDDLYTSDEIGRIANVSNKMKTMLLEYSFNDPLTGGLNVKAYHEELNDLFEEEENSKEFWCVIADMNNLKQINDYLGHFEGDNAIRKSYAIVNDHFIKYGKTFRVGGDEFVSILTGCTREKLEKIISDITYKITTVNSDSTHRFSVAFGFDKFIGKTMVDYNEFFKVVDKKMYKAKLEGKQSKKSR